MIFCRLWWRSARSVKKANIFATNRGPPPFDRVFDPTGLPLGECAWICETKKRLVPHGHQPFSFYRFDFLVHRFNSALLRNKFSNASFFDVSIVASCLGTSSRELEPHCIHNRKLLEHIRRCFRHCIASLGANLGDGH